MYGLIAPCPGIDVVESTSRVLEHIAAEPRARVPYERTNLQHGHMVLVSKWPEEVGECPFTSLAKQFGYSTASPYGTDVTQCKH